MIETVRLFPTFPTFPTCVRVYARVRAGKGCNWLGRLGTLGTPEINRNPVSCLGVFPTLFPTRSQPDGLGTSRGGGGMRVEKPLAFLSVTLGNNPMWK